jgi:hypothetical protein
MAGGRPAEAAAAPAHERHEYAPPAESGKTDAQPQNEGRQGMRGNREWTRYPLILPVMAPRGERGANTLALKNLEAQALEVYAPDKTHRQLPVAAEGTRVEPVAPKSGNYYWVAARVEGENVVTVASTATYFSNPGAAPTDLLQASKHELEIVPQFLPREHGAYRESEKWRFLVRYAGRPLAGKKLTLETEFGSHRLHQRCRRHGDGALPTTSNLRSRARGAATTAGRAAQSLSWRRNTRTAASIT